MDEKSGRDGPDDKKLNFFSLFRKKQINSFFFTTPDKSIWASFTMRYYEFCRHFYYLIDKAMA